MGYICSSHLEGFGAISSTMWAENWTKIIENQLKMVSADTIFSRFSIISTQFSAHMVSEMGPKPSKYEEHIYSEQLRPKNKNGQNYPILGSIDGGGTLKKKKV